MRFSAQRITWMVGFVFTTLAIENGICQESAQEKKPVLTESQTEKEGSQKKPITVLVASNLLQVGIGNQFLQEAGCWTLS